MLVKAKAKCFVDGVRRDAGEKFNHSPRGKLPKWLEKVSGDAQKPESKPESKPGRKPRADTFSEMANQESGDLGDLQQ